jgi:NAD(P)-dependent dehydrogenase (short-subunit alcohol dehydrogenase family)
MGGLTLSLEGKAALVTGGSSGLGPHIVNRLDEAGAAVAIHYHQNAAGAGALLQGLQHPGAALRADLGNGDEVRGLFRSATEQLGPVSILVNCAAVESQAVAALEAVTLETWAATQRTNVDAPLILTQMFVAQDIGGSVINISSIEGSRPARGHGHYSTSKAALEMLTKSCALEFGAKGVRVNAIAPGLLWRRGLERDWPEGVSAWKQAAPMAGLVQPEDIANAVLFLASGASASITGTVLPVDAGMSIQPGW